MVLPTVRKFAISVKLLPSVPQGLSQLAASSVTLVRGDTCLVLQNSHKTSMHRHPWLSLHSGQSVEMMIQAHKIDHTVRATKLPSEA